MRVHAELSAARERYCEEPRGALAEAVRCHELGRTLTSDALCARALALQAAVAAHRGNLERALELIISAARHSERDEHPFAKAEIAGLRAQLSFFSGAYSEALRHAEAAIAAADRTDDLALRIHVRRTTCMVFGNIGVEDVHERIEQLLRLAIQASDPWNEAVSRNDLACYLQAVGELDEAERELDLGLLKLAEAPGPSRFAEAVLCSTYADVLLAAGRPAEALAKAERALILLGSQAEANPYVLGATVRAEVQARMALGKLDDAKRAGEEALSWLGGRVPQTRGLILSTLAEVLREAGRLEAAYDMLARAGELERQAFRELSSLQLKLEQASLEASAARRENDELLASNRLLAEAHEELARRANQLEVLREQLQEQANHDWLTGLHNRRYLAGELERRDDHQDASPFSLAVIDLDRFKAVNDRFGHAVGDQVMIGVAQLLTGTMRISDVVVRVGGEEFLLLMPSTSATAAIHCCRRICEELRERSWMTAGGGVQLTASIGIATSAEADDFDAVVALADGRLYDAKRAGGDCVRGVAAAGSLVH